MRLAGPDRGAPPDRYASPDVADVTDARYPSASSEAFMNWQILAASLPILPGDLVWGPSSEGLTRRVTNGSRGEYLALDDNDMLARFDARLGERLGVGGVAQVLKTAGGWSVIGEKVVSLAHTTPDPLVARVLLWEGAKVEAAPEVVAVEAVAPEAKEPDPVKDATPVKEATPSAPSPTKGKTAR